MEVTSTDIKAKPYTVTVPFHLTAPFPCTPEAPVEDETYREILETKELPIRVVARPKDNGYEVVYGWHYLNYYSSLFPDNQCAVELRVEPLNDIQAIKKAIWDYGHDMGCHKLKIARALQRVKEQFKLSDSDLKDATNGLPRSSINNLLRLTTLDEEVQTAYLFNEISFSMAKLLCGRKVTEQASLLNLYRDSHWGYWDLYYHLNPNAKKLDKDKSTQSVAPVIKDNDTVKFQDYLSSLIGAPASIDPFEGSQAVKLSFAFYSVAEISNIIESLMSKGASGAALGKIELTFDNTSKLNDFVGPLMDEDF